jgi:APA family basic amino acid/polyamine antiporter
VFPEIWLPGDITLSALAELSRPLTRLNAVAMVAGTIIGASIFVQPSEIARHLETPLQIMFVWAACGVLTLFGAMVCAELASAFPQTGGVYVFMRDVFSPLAGFLWGWAMFWSMHTGIVAAIAMVFARYAAFFLPVGDRGIRAIAVGVILALSALNYVGVRAGSRVQTILTGAKVAAIVAMVAIALLLADHAPAAPAVAAGQMSGPSGAGFLREFLLAMVAGLFAYGGWHMVTYTAGETRMPATVIPSALVAGVAIVTACYVALNLVYLRVLPIDVVRSSTRIAADAADAVVGRGGSAMLAVLVMMSSAGALTGIILTGPRVYYSMAQDGLAPGWFGYIHPVHRTPSHAIVAQALWASVLAATGVYRQVFTRVIYTEWLFFALMAAGLFVLRRRAGYNPVYRTWGYPVVPLVFIVVSLAIVINQFASTPLEAATGLGLVALGAPVYYWRHAHR